MMKLLNNLPALFALGFVVTLSLFLSNNNEEMRVAQLISPLMGLGMVVSFFLRNNLTKVYAERDFESVLLDEAFERRQKRAA